MKLSLLKTAFLLLIFTACSTSRNNVRTDDVSMYPDASDQPLIAADLKPLSLMDLPQTEHGGFVLKPGFYEAEFKTYCLQPGTPDPRQGDAYLQGPISGYRKEIVQSILQNSKDHPEMDQKNIQLLLWNVVSGSHFSNLSYQVQSDAAKLLTPKQIFELKGGTLGVIKEISSRTGLLNANGDIKRLFDASVGRYEAYDRIAVRREQSKVVRNGVK